VIALVRGEESMVNPSADQELASGDCLVLVGSHGQVDNAFRYLDEYAEAIQQSEETRSPENS
jgi:K+/H+ antiporter YhaU regulatory subunit KhtT